jgi:SnoaL-like domain
MTKLFPLSALTLAVALLAAAPAHAGGAGAKVTSIKDPERRALIERMQLADKNLDAQQGDAWATDGTFQIGANPPVTGPAAVKGFLGGFFGMKLFTKIEHRFVEVVEQRDKLIYNAIVTYTLPSGETLEIPYVNWITFKREGKQLKFASYRVFIDSSPLMAKVKMRP